MVTGNMESPSNQSLVLKDSADAQSDPEIQRIFLLTGNGISAVFKSFSFLPGSAKEGMVWAKTLLSPYVARWIALKAGMVPVVRND